MSVAQADRGLVTARAMRVHPRLRGLDAFQLERRILHGYAQTVDLGDDEVAIVPHDPRGGAAAPVYAATPRLGFGSVTAANTNRDGTGTIVDLLTGVTAGTRIERLVLQATGNPADSVVTVYLHDGTSYRLFDEFDLGDPSAASTTLPGYRAEKRYSDIVIPSSSWKVAAAITVALTAGAINAFVFGADLT